VKVLISFVVSMKTQCKKEIEREREREKMCSKRSEKRLTAWRVGKIEKMLIEISFLDAK
jgi:hypothetical protein